MDVIDRRATRRRDAGFTLIEAMIAGTVGVLLLLPAYAMLRRTSNTAFTVISRFQRDAEARQMLTMLGEGSSGTVGAAFVRGLRSQGTVPPGWALSQNGVLVINDTSSQVSISGDQTLICTAGPGPLHACAAPGPTTNTGWLGSPPTVAPPANGRTVAVGITVVDPYEATRPGQTSNTASDTYRSQFNLNVQ